MALSLSNLKASKRKKVRRLGRGDGSGRGTYSSRGLKGQRSRSGGKKKLKRKGLKQFLHQIPKNRGFKSMYRSLEIVNVGQLNNFDNNEIITPDKMIDKGLLSHKDNGVKILGHGDLKKKLTISAHSFSKSAENVIKKAGGNIVVIGAPEANKEVLKKVIKK